MKAVRFHEHGGVEKLRFEEAERPELTAPTEVIVEMKAAAVNPIDIRSRRGLEAVEIPLPRIPGADGAGVVVETGARAGPLKRGDRVCLVPAGGCGECGYCLAGDDFLCVRPAVLGRDADGTYAAYVKVPACDCLPIPAALSFEEAAALPLDYASAWKMLVTDAQLEPGEHVLIVGIEGGPAIAALQISKQMGAHVVVTSDSDEKLELAMHWGADHAINHRTTPFAGEVRALTRKRGVDVAVHCAAGENWSQCFAALARGGRLTVCDPPPGATAQTDLRRIFWNHLSVYGCALGGRADLIHALRFLEASRLRPVVDQLFPLREAGNAQRRLEQNRHFGKIVLQIDEPGAGAA